MQTKLVTLDNGLKIIVISKDVYTVDAAITVKTGMINETDNENGISHFLEHMAFKGTKTKTSKELIGYVENLGGNANAYTTNDRTCYTASLPGNFWKEACDFLADIVRNSTFPENEFEKERDVIIQEYKQRNDDPSYLGYYGLMSIGFEGHRLGRQVIGKLENIENFKREDLLNYYKKYYTASNMIFSLVIPETYNLEEVLNYISNLFIDLEKGENEIFEYTKIIENKKEVLYKSGIGQSYIYMGIPAIKINSEWQPVYDIMTTIFDGGMSTRLFQTMREKLGLTYHTSIFTDTCRISNTFGIFSIVEQQNEDKAIEAIKDTFLTLSNSITDEELNKAKNMVAYAFDVANEGKKIIKYYVNQLFYFNKEFNFQEELDKRMNVTKEQIFKLAKAMLNKEFTIFIVRPKQESDINEQGI